MKEGYLKKFWEGNYCRTVFADFWKILSKKKRKILKILLNRYSTFGYVGFVSLNLVWLIIVERETKTCVFLYQISKAW